MSKRNWRPHVLVFVDDAEKRLSLVRFGCWFAQERGVVTVCELVEGDLLADDPVDLQERRARLQAVCDREDLTVFAEADMVRDVVEGITNVSQANGMAGLTSNTVLLGWPREPARMALFLQTVRRLERLRKSVVIGRADPSRLPTTGRRRRRVHVWWGGLQQNGDLMLLLAYLLTRNPEWRGAELKILNIASNEFARTNTERYLKELLPELRIDATVHVMLKPPKSSVREVIRMQSGEADVVFFGLATPDEGEEEAYAGRLEELAGHFPVVFLVKNSSLFVGQLVKPEELEAPDEPEKTDSDAN